MTNLLPGYERRCSWGQRGKERVTETMDELLAAPLHPRLHSLAPFLGRKARRRSSEHKDFNMGDSLNLASVPAVLDLFAKYGAR